MSTSLIVHETCAGEPLSPYSLASEESTNPPDLDSSSTKSESNSPAPKASGPPLVLNSNNIVSSSFVPPPAPLMGEIEMLTVSAALRQMIASLYIDDHLDTLQSPSPETSTDHPSARTPSLPIQVNTPKPQSPIYVEDQGNPVFAATLRPKDCGPIWEDIVCQSSVQATRCRICYEFHSYFSLLGGPLLDSQTLTGSFRRLARRRLYQSVMDHLDCLLAKVEEVHMLVVG
ncbi:hypothetical protein PTTG_26319 [Puccinia triticina 1-1 BBBD Race 1]|uniref:Uncharacterized protein n=1 Tax=Puccinia triticina (isolate 1-1 / race 1 (BBBD)) TaxID=630390 RepID=A0A180GVG0_PUCT1|nr:hypothetical protein PTTG_26319 [Puccinia triticina 1-1 BBBD Race 1]